MAAGGCSIGKQLVRPNQTPRWVLLTFVLTTGGWSNCARACLTETPAALAPSLTPCLGKSCVDANGCYSTGHSTLPLCGMAATGCSCLKQLGCAKADTSPASSLHWSSRGLQTPVQPSRVQCSSTRSHRTRVQATALLASS